MLSTNINLAVGRRSSDTTFDLIYKYYFGDKEIALSEQQNKIRVRWRKAWDLLCSLKSRPSVVKVIVKEFHVDERTAYLDIKNAELLFQDPNEGNKQIHRTKVNRWIEMLMEKAYESGDLELIEKLIGRYIKNNNTEIEDNPMAEYLKGMKPTQVILTADTEALRAAAEALMADVKDVQHVEIPNEQD